MAVLKLKASFVEPMLLLQTDTLPADPGRWKYEIKQDGYRAIAYKTGGRLYLRSRNDNDFALRYPAIAQALAALPNETAIDGEVVALDPSGKPSFHLLQNHGSTGVPLLFFVFDVMVLSGVSVMDKTLDGRQQLLEKKVLPKLAEPVRYVGDLNASLGDLIASVKAAGLEGLVAKRRGSAYEAGVRSGAWLKMRINQGQELVIGGYTVGSRGFDALVIGYYENGRLLYASRTRNGFTPASREELFKKLKPLHTEVCPFTNLPEAQGGRWGQGLTAAKMKECRWLRPELVGQFEFVGWTSDHHLRHTRFMGLRDDKDARQVTRERG